MYVTSTNPNGGSGRNADMVTVSSRGVDAAIAKLASKQQGNITRQQLLSLGLDDAAIAYRLKVGRLFRVFRGVYSVGRRPITVQEWASAAVLAGGAGAALSHTSAMVLWGYWRHWETPIDVTVVGDRRTRGIRVHRSTTLHRRDVTTQLGVRVTTPARTALDMSPRLNDEQLKRTVNNMLHSLWAHKDQFAETVARHRTAPGAKRIARLLGLPGTPSRSGWEDDFPAFCAKYGLPVPVMGAPLFGFIADALFPAERVIVELDSKEFHMDPLAFESDRDRDADMLAHRYVTVRATWDRIHELPEREASRLHTILANQRQIHAPSAA